MERVSDKQRRQQAFETMCKTFRPYRGRITAEWSDKQRNAVYLWNLYRTKPNEHDQYEPLGAVMVNIIWDGSVFIYLGELEVARALAVPHTGRWEDTVAILAKLEAA